MGPLGLLGNLLHGTERFVGGLVNRFAPKKQPPKPVQQSKPQPRLNINTITRAVGQIPKVQLQGLTQLKQAFGGGSTPVTIGSVAKATPVLGQAIKFGQTKNPTLGQFARGIAGAGIQGAGYVAPELRLLRAGATAPLLARAGARFVNQAVPAAGLSAAGDVVGGERNVGKISKTALLNAIGAGATNAAPTLARGAVKGIKANPVLRSQKGFINPGASVAGYKPAKTGNIEEAFAQVQDLKSSIAGHQQAFQDAKKAIELSGATPNQKNQQLQQLSKEIGGQVHDLQTELGGWQEHLQSLGSKVQGNPITAPSQPVKSQPKPSILKKLLAPLQSEAGFIAGTGSKKAAKANTPEDFPRVKQQLNVNRLNLTEPQKADVLGRGATEPKATLSNKEVEQIAKGAGIDLKTHTIDQTKEAIAKQLNVRSEAVRLKNAADAEADPLKKAQIYAELDKHAAISTQQGTHIARQLQARRIIADETKSPEQRVFELLQNAGVNPDVYTKAAAGINPKTGVAGPPVDFNNGKEVIKFYRSLVPAKASEWIDLIRYNSMLSSPLTQIVNVSSTGANIAAAPIEKEVTAALDSLGALFGKERQYATGEGVAFARGALNKDTVRSAVDGFKNVIKGLDQGMDLGASSGEPRIPIAATGQNKIVDVLDFPSRLLGAFDEFSRALVRGGSNATLNLRQAKGIRIGNKTNIGNAEAAYRTFNKPLGEADQGPVLRAIDEVTNLVMKARSSKNPVLKWPAKFSLPFVRIGTNLLKQGIEYSPAGVATIPGALERTPQLAKAIMGTAVMGTAGALLGNNRLTWAAPTDVKKRQAWEAAGMQPYSVKIGENWVGFSKLPPVVSFNFAFAAALDDALKNGKINENQLDAIMKAASQYANFIADQSFFKQIGDTLAAVKGDPTAFSKMIGNIPQQLIPFRAFTGWLARITDDTKRTVNTDAGFFGKQLELLMQQYPGLRQQTTARLDVNGAPIPSQHPLLNAISPVSISTEDSAGKDYYNMLQQKSLDTANKNVEAKQAKAAGSSSTVLDQSTKRVEKATSGFAEGLDEDSKKVLSRYARLNANGREAFEKDSKNVLALKQAQYRQNKLSGKLTPAQDYKAQRNLAKLAVTTQFSPDVLALHGFSKRDLSSYFESNPGDRKNWSDVLKLDKALTDVGIQAKGKFAKGLSIGRGKGKTKIKRISLKAPRLSKTPKIKLAKARTTKFKLPRYTSKSSGKSFKITA